MATLSDPTLGMLIEVSTANNSASDLRTVLMSSGLWNYVPGDWTYDQEGVTKQELMQATFLRARDSVRHWDPEVPWPTGPEAEPEVLRALLAFVKRVLNRSGHDPQNPAPWFDELREALLADGYQLTWDRRMEQPAHLTWTGPRPKVVVSYELLPTDPTAAPLDREIDALEADLDKRGYITALRHYREAVDSFVHHNYLAANSQLRTALEAVVVDVAKTHAGYVGQGKSGEGGPAIKHLVETTGRLPEDEGGLMLRGLWKMTHTNGSHPGLSTADEARIRMQLITATMRILLNHFP